MTNGKLRRDRRGAVDYLKNRTSLKKAIMPEGCKDTVRLPDGDKAECHICTEGMPDSSFVILGEPLIQKEKRRKCDCIILYERDDGSEPFIAIVLAEIRSRLPRCRRKDSRGRAKFGLKFKHASEEVRSILRSLSRRMNGNLEIRWFPILISLPLAEKQIDMLKGKTVQCGPRRRLLLHKVCDPHKELHPHLLRDIIDFKPEAI